MRAGVLQRLLGFCRAPEGVQRRGPLRQGIDDCCVAARLSRFSDNILQHDESGFGTVETHRNCC
jgi:hypothetical protein